MPNEVVLIKLVVIEDEIKFIYSRSDNINVLQPTDKRNPMAVSSSGIIFYIQKLSPAIDSLI